MTTKNNEGEINTPGYLLVSVKEYEQMKEWGILMKVKEIEELFSLKDQAHKAEVERIVKAIKSYTGIAHTHYEQVRKEVAQDILYVVEKAITTPLPESDKSNAAKDAEWEETVINARHSWLISEIEKLDGMKKIEKDEQREIVLDNGGKVKGQTHYPNNVGYNQALTSIFTRYKEELKVLESK